MRIGDAFPESNLLNAEDIGRHKVKVKVARVTIEQVGNNEAPVMSFEGKTKRLKLNRTNATVLEDELGEETNDWRGATLELYTEKVMFQGRMTSGIRVRVLEKPDRSNEPEALDATGSDDDIPF